MPDVLYGPYNPTATWPQVDPTVRLQRVVSRRSARAKSGTYLKAYGSRPEGKANERGK